LSEKRYDTGPDILPVVNYVSDSAQIEDDQNTGNDGDDDYRDENNRSAIGLLRCPVILSIS